jgi:hypothetical protein
MHDLCFKDARGSVDSQKGKSRDDTISEGSDLGGLVSLSIPGPSVRSSS